jgi:electron transfer flavoprotein alpha subunit
MPTAALDSWEGVWTVAEQRQGELVKISLEMLTPARTIADKLQTRLTVVLIGDSGVSALARELIEHGADHVICVEHPALRLYRTQPYSEILTDLVLKRKPEIVLIGASRQGRDLSSRIAVSAQAGVTADCTELDADLETRLLLAKRPAFGGRQLATIVCDKHCPQMATARLGVFEVPRGQPGREGSVEVIALDVDEGRINARVAEFSREDEVDIQAASIIVSGGKGVGGPEGFGAIKDLAEALGGVVGASRAAVDSGWIARSHQVGQTGKSVNPKLYVACGISGAVQHLAGMKTSKVIVAINKDPKAQIFKYADVGIVGDLFEVIPALVKILGSGAMSQIRREAQREMAQSKVAETAARSASPQAAAVPAR